MEKSKVFTLINHQDGNLAFKMFSFHDNSYFDHVQRNNFYSLIWVKKGKGLLKVDFSEYAFAENSFFAFAPFQPFMLSTNEQIEGVAVQFHADFYCIHRNPKETNCDTVLFNNIYQAPFFRLKQGEQARFTLLIEQFNAEFAAGASDNYELLIPHLKIFLGTASRIKSKSNPELPRFTSQEVPLVLHRLKKEIESNFRTKHSASAYAKSLNISANSLSKLVSSHYNKTITHLITERIIIEAKRELYLTKKPIKEIAWHLGYSDEYYFSRVFKKNTDVSPQGYRDNVGFGKAEII